MGREPHKAPNGGRLDPDTLRPELRSPEMHRVMLAYVELLAGRLKVVEEYRRRGIAITVTDSIITLSIFTWAHEGTRPQYLIDTLGMPRRTVRDSLTRLERQGVVVREANGRYYPAQVVAEISNTFWDRHSLDIRRLCDTISDYRNASRR